MVGYNKNDTMTANQKFIAGCVSGMMTRFMTQPLDVIKLKTQLQKQATTPEEKKKWFKYTRLIIKEEGVTALWHGHNLGQLQSIVSVTAQFFVYEMATKYVEDHFGDSSYKPVLNVMSGVLGGCCSACLSTPLEVIRVRQMLVKNQYKGIIGGAREVYNSGGFVALYEGLSANLLQMGPQVGIAFSVFALTQPLILNYFDNCEGAECSHASHKPKPENILLSSTLAGSLAGLISKTITYPFDLVKRRMQIGSHKADERFKTPASSQNVVRCTKLTDCIVHTFRSEGLFGLFRGWTVTMYKAQLTSIVSFTTYELMCYVFREYK